MEKAPIGILDMSLDNISLLNTVKKEFKSEHFIYVNDLACPEYEGLPVEEIQTRVQANVEYLMTRGVKLIVVTSNTIVEYCRNYFNEIAVPVVNMVDTIIHEVNERFEHKNMVFLTSENIMQANMYQKFFRYNHLYNIVCDRLNQLIMENKTKTNESFMTTKELFKYVIKRDIDIIILTNTNLEYLTTEIKEFMRDVEILDLSMILCGKIKAALLTIENINTKGSTKLEICFQQAFIKTPINHLLKTKYQLKKRK